MDLHIHSRCSCYLFFFFLPGYPLSRSVSNARYVTSRVPAYKEVKDVWKCSCSNIYIHVYSLPLAFFAILYLSLPSSRSRHQLFQYFFFFPFQGSVVPAEGIIFRYYSNVRFLFAERSVVILIYEKLD